jgi:hypothetical protein
METNERNLNDLKEEYKRFQIKYDLPSFEELNDIFQIEKLAETETDFLMKEMRKLVAERLFNYLRFLESLLNPANVPMFVYSIIKTFDTQDKEKITKVYKKLAKREVELIGLDLSSTEEKEVRFIKDSYNLWQDIKEDILSVVEVIKKNWDVKSEVGKKDYFG